MQEIIYQKKKKLKYARNFCWIFENKVLLLEQLESWNKGRHAQLVEAVQQMGHGFGAVW